MKINSRIIRTLLSLPCLIDEEMPFMDIPLFTKAREIAKGCYTIKILPDENLKSFFRRVYGDIKYYDLDCAIFIQIATIMIENRWPINGGHIKYYIPADSKIASAAFWKHKHPNTGYIGAYDKSTSRKLNDIGSSSKGEWVMRIDHNSYLGLAYDGPAVMPLEVWVKRLRKALIEFCKPKSNDSKVEISEKKIVSNLIKRQKLDDWVFYTEPDNWVVHAKCTPNEIIITYA